MKALFVLPLFFLTSCGYHLTSNAFLEPTHTVTLPFIEGDEKGLMTDSLTYALSKSGYFRCAYRGGDYILKISLKDKEKRDIGWRYDRENNANETLMKNLMPVEARRSIIAQVSLLDGITEEVLYGPYDVVGEIDFDMVNATAQSDLSFTNSLGQTVTTMDFSLGQLDAIEGAQKDAMIPLYSSLAEKIVEGIMQWVENIPK